MHYQLENLDNFFTACFGHYFVLLALAMLWFIFWGRKGDVVLRVFVIGFWCTLVGHTAVRAYNMRHMLIPVLISLPVIAYAAVELKDRCVSLFRFGRWVFLALALLFAFLSFLKFHRSGRNPRDAAVMTASRLLREDFVGTGAGEAVIISNGDNGGMVFFYAGIPGNFHRFDFSSDSASRQAVQQVELLCSQYPLVYVLKERRTGKTKTGDGIFNCELRFPHSYATERIDRGLIDPRGKYGKFELFRIESRCAATDGGAQPDGFADTPSRTLDNGDFSRWHECPLSMDPRFGNGFLAKYPRQKLPVGWDVDFNNRRGVDFSNWSFACAPAESPSGNASWSFHAPNGGFAIRSRQKLPVGGDCRLNVAAKMGAGCKFLAFLYVYRKDGVYLSAQPVGVYRCEKPGDIVLSFPVRNKDIPADGAFFYVGLIGWNGEYSLKKIDLAYDADNER
ncbi:MAG: hypothetical protein J6Y54_06890 [Lentisphaeria bacterium]|nr:hypothetical protein [Lentisphaeria bacterium]